MAKELLIMRHAKSSWADETMDDHDRPLNDRGQRDAPRMARFLQEQRLVPDIILSSSANRAVSTAELVVETLNLGPQKLEIIDDFYLAPPEIYIEYLRRLAGQYARPMVIGHNPGLEFLLAQHVNSMEAMPTAAIAHLQFEIEDWSDLSTGTKQCRLSGVYRPREL